MISGGKSVLYAISSKSFVHSAKYCSNNRAKSWLAQCRKSVNRYYTIHRKLESSKLGETSVFVQNGHGIDEVPIAVLKKTSQCQDSDQKISKEASTEIFCGNGEELIDTFKRYHTPQQLLKVLDTIPHNEVNSEVSVSILERLFELENNFGWRNNGTSWVVASDDMKLDAFSRFAIVSQLVDTVIASQNKLSLLRTLEILKKDSINREIVENPKSSVYTDAGGLKDDKPNGSSINSYRNKIFEEVLVKISLGQLDLKETCQAIQALGKIQESQSLVYPSDIIDKMWPGIVNNEAQITNPEQLLSVFRILKHMKQSFGLIYNLSEKKAFQLMWQLDPKTAAEICRILLHLKGNPIYSSTVKRTNFTMKHSSQGWRISPRLLSVLAKTISANIHLVTEDELMTALKCFTQFNFTHHTIEKALDKYMQLKGAKISKPDLLVWVMNYCQQFRYRRPSIFEAAAAYLIQNNASLSGPQFISIFIPFGTLDFQPSNGVKFWETVENFLDEKFIQLSPKELILTFLSCVYLSKFPYNFVPRLFSPYFLDRLHINESDAQSLQEARSNLKLLDSAFTIECSHKYSGPRLPKDFTARSIFIDGRIVRMSGIVENVLKDLYDSQYNINRSFILPGLPLNQNFFADILLTSKSIDGNVNSFIRNLVNSKQQSRKSDYSDKKHDVEIIALLIHLPEHYSHDGKNLIGPQVMRIRHLKLLGFKVVCLNSGYLSHLHNSQAELQEYISQAIGNDG